MRHKYETRGIVLARAPAGETNAFVVLLTPELGLMCARAQGVRRQGAKLAPALTTFAESSLVLVRGREGWHVAGAVLEENWFARMQQAHQHQRAARVTGLFLRLVAGEARDTKLFPAMRNFFESLAALPEEEHEAAEVLVALRILSALGLDSGEIPGDASAFSPSPAALIGNGRPRYIARINRGIAASGL